MLEWLIRNLGCCCAGAEFADGPTENDPLLPSGENLDELLALQARLRQEEQQRKLAHLEQQSNRQLNKVEDRCNSVVYIQGATLNIDTAAAKNFKDATGLKIDAAAARMLDKFRGEVELNANMQMDLRGSAKGPKLSFRVKDPVADPVMEETWYRQNSLLSFTCGFVEVGDTRQMYIDRLDVKDGKCKQFFCGLLDTATAMNLTELKLQADDIGRYAWIRYGFRPVRAGEGNWDQLRHKARILLDSLEDQMDPDLYEQAKGLLADSDPEAIVGVANLKIPVGGLNLGFRLVKASMWTGVFNLQNAQAVQIVKTYIGYDE